MRPRYEKGRVRARVKIPREINGPGEQNETLSWTDQGFDIYSSLSKSWVRHCLQGSHRYQGVATKFRLGEDGFCLGERIQVSQNQLPPNSDFSSDFAHFILKFWKF